MQKPGDIGRKSMDPACDVETNQASTLLRQVAKSEVSKQAFFDASWLMESRPPMIPAMIPAKIPAMIPAMIPYAACPIHFQTLTRTSFPMLPIEVARSQSAAAHHGHTPPFERPGSANPTCHAAECCEPLWKWLLCHLPSSYTLILTSPGNVGHELGYKSKKKSYLKARTSKECMETVSVRPCPLAANNGSAAQLNLLWPQRAFEVVTKSLDSAHRCFRSQGLV